VIQILRSLWVGCLLVAAAWGAERWQIQYFYDEDRSSLTINDLKFPSARRGVAVGFIKEKDKIKPTAVVTSDGGAHWSLAPIKETGLSLFFLDDSIGWMVTSKGLWQTEESGRSWRKLKAPPQLLRVYFLDRQHGWAAGMHKAVYETTDGGKQWTKVAAAETPKTNPEYTQYGWIDFVDQKIGMITGWSRPPRRSDQRLPDWLDPEKAERRREWPNLSIVLETRDRGKNWSPATTSMFGRITRVRLSPNGSGLALIEFFESFEWPSEVFRLNWQTGKSARVYREKTRAITDIALPPAGPAYLAGLEVAGKLRRSPIPGKLKILKSDDWSNWKEMDVDYRATAGRATLAVADERNIWVATDTGIILKLIL
jgi:hypothetical protein